MRAVLYALLAGLALLLFRPSPAAGEDAPDLSPLWRAIGRLSNSVSNLRGDLNALSRRVDRVEERVDALERSLAEALAEQNRLLREIRDALLEQNGLLARALAGEEEGEVETLLALRREVQQLREAVLTAGREVRGAVLTAGAPSGTPPEEEGTAGAGILETGAGLWAEIGCTFFSPRFLGIPTPLAEEVCDGR